MIKKGLILLFIVALASCEKYLDIKPYGKTIPKTAEEFSALIHSHLDNIDFGSDEVILGGVSSVINFEMYGDNFEACLTEKEASSLPVYIGNLLENTYSSSYERLYKVIRDCNIVIEELEDRESDLAKEVLGTATALRGVCYFQLLRQFCEAPRNAKEQLGLAIARVFDMEDRPIRSSMEETIIFIENDFKKAVEYKVKNEIYRFTEDVAKAYLSRLYFWTEQWEKAIPLLNELLTNYPIIEGDAYKQMIESGLDKKGNMLIKSYLYSSVSSANANVNLAALKYKPISKRYIDAFPENERQNDIRYKLHLNKLRQTEKNAFACLRSAELELMLAECHYHSGDESTALQIINRFRAKRISPYEQITADALPEQPATEIIKEDATGKPLTKLLSLILRERRKELFMEGDRWFELKRNGSPEFWDSYDGKKFVTQPYMYTFPLPITDVELTEGLKQNEGYETIIN